MADPEARRALADTAVLSTLRPQAYDGAFFSGGLGPVFDLCRDATSIAFVESLHAAGRPVAAVCHGLAAWLNARDSLGRPLVAGRGVTGFSNSEERAANGPGVVPFLIEDELRRLGARYSCAPDGEPHVVVDGILVSGQNPPSSAPAARKLIELAAARSSLAGSAAGS
jgi:putative intracellular protease/amidase